MTMPDERRGWPALSGSVGQEFDPVTNVGHGLHGPLIFLAGSLAACERCRKVLDVDDWLEPCLPATRTADAVALVFLVVEAVLFVGLLP